MSRPLELISHVLPLTFAYDALLGVADRPGISSSVMFDAAVTIAMGVGWLALGSLTLRRGTA
jgi:ABC-2 type transport system permease protein